MQKQPYRGAVKHNKRLRAIIGRMEYHLAQLNIGKMVAPTDDPLVAEFMDQLDEINAIADEAPGFVWRLQTEDGNATSIHAFEDPLLLVNMSVWESIDALYQFTYRSPHTGVMRQRMKWFEKHDGPYQVMWWVPAGHIPTIDEAKKRLDMLAEHGPTAEAFTFRLRFDSPES